MDKISKSTILPLILLTVCAVSLPAKADTSIYVFDPNQSIVIRSGGIAGIQKTFYIAGQFRLTVDSGVNTASFEIVDANLAVENGTVYGQSLDEIFNMTGLAGNVVDETTIEFEGKTADGTESDVRLKLSLSDGSAHLTGNTTPPPNSADMFFYDVNAVATKKYAGGTGEPNDPYQIATAEDLMLLGESPEDYDKHFILTDDIDLDPNLPGRKVFDKAVIAPDDPNISWSNFVGIPFNGVIDGNGHTICHLTIDGENYLGLFGQLDSGANISNLGLEATDVSGTGDWVGGLVGYSFGTITTSYSTGRVTGREVIGGLVGFNCGRIAGCYSSDTVSGVKSVGGLVGRNYVGTIFASYSTGTVTGGTSGGGLVGNNYGGSITLSYSTGTVTGGTSGGLAGSNSYIARITNCYSTGMVTGGMGTGSGAVGGLVGDNEGIITNSYSTGMVSGYFRVGGLVGRGSPSGVAGCYWDIQNSGQSGSTGGLGLTTAEMQDISTFISEGWDFVGENLNGTSDYWEISPGDYPRLRYHIGNSPVMPEGLGTIEEPYLIRDARDLGTVWFRPMAHYRLETTIDLSGITWSMAVVPWFGGTFDGNGYVISNLHIQGDGFLGLFGQLDSGAIISNMSLEAIDVNGTGRYIGGLVGDDNGGSITESYSTGTVNGVAEVGGLVGDNGGSITLSYSTGTVTGSGGVGGLVGSNGGSITLSYSTGTVTGSGGVGGLVGGNGGSIIESYSTGTVNGDNEVGGLVGGNGGSITESYSMGTVSGDGGHIGGLVGWNIGPWRSAVVGEADISYSYSTCTVEGDYDVGGLVGWNDGGSIADCYSIGIVTGEIRVGGLVGGNIASWGSAEITDSYWNIETSSRPNMCGDQLNGTGCDPNHGKTTSEMKQQSTFTGWDFVGETDNGTEDIWSICEGTNYPRFVWQIPVGDFVCPDGVAIEDFAFFMEHWLDDNCDSSNNYCEGTDLNQSGTVDVIDLEIFFENWPG
jgi:hypothetical protein